MQIWFLFLVHTQENNVLCCVVHCNCLRCEARISSLVFKAWQCETPVKPPRHTWHVCMYIPWIAKHLSYIAEYMTLVHLWCQLCSCVWSSRVHSSSTDPIKLLLALTSLLQEPKTWLPVPFRTRHQHWAARKWTDHCQRPEPPAASAAKMEISRKKGVPEVKGLNHPIYCSHPIRQGVAQTQGLSIFLWYMYTVQPIEWEK